MADEQKKNEHTINELLENIFHNISNPSNNSGANKNSDIAVNQSDKPQHNQEEIFLGSNISLIDRICALYNAANIPAEHMPHPEQILTSFKKMSEAASLTLQGENTASDDDVAKYSSNIAEALKCFQRSTNNLATPVSDVDMAKIVGDLVPDTDSSKEDNAFLPFMEGMMQSLLSAEMMLPIVKDLLEKYPKYLADNGDKITPEDKERYIKQLAMYKVIEGHLETSNPNNSSKVKRDIFRLVLDDMRKLQQYGQSPEPISAETGSNTPWMDGIGGAGDSVQCSMM